MEIKILKIMKNSMFSLALLPVLILGFSMNAPKTANVNKSEANTLENRAKSSPKKAPHLAYLSPKINGVMGQGDYVIPYGTPNGQHLEVVTSANGAYKLWIQTDGNLVLRRHSDGKPLWTSNTDGTTAIRTLRVHANGNLYLMNQYQNDVWWNAQVYVTVGSGFTWILQDDGNLVRYDTDGHNVDTGTAGGKVSWHNHEIY
ncbi:hypothetical protein ABIE26_003571 [Pedobacter africanus]|uniref:Uncharacterized protein n=1 Tax=Pedobacter africanus TaxID=151894 RepID=A0ACC6L0H8_9SPHI|nr:hypothetical protein [Pedobacter africanus]MDR6784925.1 hypothetical protein [Pedobacter africanus]